MAEMRRRKTVTTTIGGVRVGSDAPVMVQSMTNTDTADIPGTIKQVADLARAGSEVVRVTVNTDEAAKAVPYIVEGLDKLGMRVPIVGDFHYNGHLLLTKYPGCAEGLAKYRINPGNASIGRKNDDNFRTMIEVAVKHQKPVRIGVNWGSLDQALLTRMMDENSLLPEPKDAREVTMEAIVVSALTSAKLAERHGLRPDQIILSAKVSGVQDLIDVYRLLSARCEYPLHLGLTEAGLGSKGIVASTAALSVLLQEMADQIQNYLRDQMPVWKEHHPGVETMKVAVMGCIVNGPGESKHANLGISLLGTFEEPVAPVYVDGKLSITLRGDAIVAEFIEILNRYVDSHYAAVREPEAVTA